MRFTRRVRAVAAAVVLLAAVVVVVVVVRPNPSRPGGHYPYASADNRQATWDTPPYGRAITAKYTQRLANSGSATFLDGATPGFDIAAHFAAARAITRAAGGKRRVYDYFNVSLWYLTNPVALQPYGRAFALSWLLRDDRSRLVPYLANAQTGRPRAFLLDLRNPALRRWIVTTIVSWMHAAPYRGVVLDSADPLLSDVVRPSVSTGRVTFGQLLCGVQPGTACPVAAEWNAGLTSLISSVHTALDALGDRTVYNGIAPSLQRGAGRNLAMVRDSSGTANESFCYGPTVDRPAVSGYLPLAADFTLMRTIALAGKIVFETTNYLQNGSRALADYCAAAFLVGWQPGSSYQIYHRTYADLHDAHPVRSAESRLDLGAPTTTIASQAGTIFTRTYRHGLVAVNGGSEPATLRIPFDVVRFAGGRAGQAANRGSTLRLPAHGSAFFLRTSWLAVDAF